MLTRSRQGQSVSDSSERDWSNTFAFFFDDDQGSRQAESSSTASYNGQSIHSSGFDAVLVKGADQGAVY